MRRVELAGKKYGRLTATRRVGRDKYRRSLWECQCECGNTIVVDSGSLASGNTRSCGCLMRDTNRRLVAERSTTHGLSRSSTYRIWAKMIERCENRRSKTYSDYGARGIKVCDRWRESFENFLSDMGPRSPGMTIERNDNDGDYCPENCRWATRKEQNNNKRNSRVLECNGKRQTVARWSEELGISSKTIFTRLYNGWSIEAALHTRKLKPWEARRITE